MHRTASSAGILHRWHCCLSNSQIQTSPTAPRAVSRYAATICKIVLLGLLCTVTFPACLHFNTYRILLNLSWLSSPTAPVGNLCMIRIIADGQITSACYLSSICILYNLSCLCATNFIFITDSGTRHILPQLTALAIAMEHEHTGAFAHFVHHLLLLQKLERWIFSSTYMSRIKHLFSESLNSWLRSTWWLVPFEPKSPQIS